MTGTDPKEPPFPLTGPHVMSDLTRIVRKKRKPEGRIEPRLPVGFCSDAESVGTGMFSTSEWWGGNSRNGLFSETA